MPAAADLLEQSPDAMVLVDSTGAIVYANRRLTSLFGVAPAALVGKPVEILIPESLRQRHVSHRVTYERDPQVRMMGDSRSPLSGRRADGTTFPVDVHLAPVRSDGQRWMLAAIRDASERYRVMDELGAAKQLADQVARMKGEFLALAAHDLSQPAQTLELLIGAIDRRAAAGSDLAELTAQAASALERIRELMKMLMEISRLESGTIPIVPEPVRVEDIFADIERQFAPAARAKDLRFNSVPCSHIVETDPALLRGMLSNLVSNAIRYTPHGEVSVRCIAPEDGSLRLAVADTGIGIPDDQMQTIFEDFRRLEAGRRTHREGFGLGLGIVRRIAALLEFSVSVQSHLGLGSTFEVAIPSGRVHHA